jgi:hypothetical protein
MRQHIHSGGPNVKTLQQHTTSMVEMHEMRRELSTLLNAK